MSDNAGHAGSAPVSAVGSVVTVLDSPWTLSSGYSGRSMTVFSVSRWRSMIPSRNAHGHTRWMPVGPIAPASVISSLNKVGFLTEWAGSGGEPPARSMICSWAEFEPISNTPRRVYLRYPPLCDAIKSSGRHAQHGYLWTDLHLPAPDRSEANNTIDLRAGSCRETAPVRASESGRFVVWCRPGCQG
jgi:hypothetical protein